MGEDKVLMFVTSIDRKERMEIRIKLEDSDGANVVSRIGLKSKEYAEDMIRGRREYRRQQHGL